MIVGGYSLDLYCRFKDCIPRPLGGFPDFCEQATTNTSGETWGECKREAQRLGWIFGHDGDVTCPNCSKAKRRAALATKDTPS